MSSDNPLEMDRLEYAEFKLDEIRTDKAGAVGANSWSAVDRLHKQERDLMAEIHALKDAAAEQGVGVDPEMALRGLILPAVGAWPRVFQEELYRHIASVLGQAGVVDA